jgi:hypothetical protein
MIFAFTLLIIGIFFLLKAMGIIAEDIWGFIWPSVLIVVALIMILRCHRRNSFWWGIRDWHNFSQRMNNRFNKH